MAAPGTRAVTSDELAAHGAAASAKWIAVHGEVFDVTAFVQLHPGGRAALEQHCGTDASKVFDYYHHGGVLGKYRAKLKVGELAGYVAKLKVVPFAEPGFFSAGSLFKSPYYKETHRRFHARVSAFVRDRLLPSMAEWEHDKAPPCWVMEAMGSEGFLACLTGAKQLPREYLDAGVPDIPDYDLFHETVLLDGLAKTASPNVVAALTSGVSIALTAVIAFGTKAQKARVVREVLMGREMIALAVSEPNAGSDVAGMMVEARRQGQAWLVSGTKKWITNAAYSKWLVTAVRTAPERPASEGTSLLLIDAELPGISMRKVGLRPEAAIAGTSFIEFDNVRVGADMLVGKENQGFVPVMHNFNHERVYLSTVALRMARVCLEECFTFAQRRMTFGKTLAEHDVIKVMLAQMACRVEQQQAWLESVVFQMQQMSKSEASELGATICGLKAQSGEVLEECARLTTHVFGGNALDAASVGRRIQHMADSQKGYVIPAGATRIMEMQMTKLAIKQAERVAKL